MLKAVIFDFDDTLIHTYENGITNMRIVADNLGLPLPSESILREHWGSSWEQLNHELWPEVNPDAISEKYSSLASSLKPFPPVNGVHEILDILSKKFVLGMVTGRDKRLFEQRLVGAGIDFSKFSFLLTQDDIQKPKSDPGYFAPVMKELEKLGITKDEILFVGDSVHDFEAARNAGIHFVGVLTGPASKEDLLQKGLEEGMIIPSVMELPHLIRNNGFSPLL